jgi:glycosyltransferase involved in cell wall biosynthesis
MMLRLVTGLDRRRYRSIVVSMTDVGEMGRQFEEAGIEFFSLSMRRGAPELRGLMRLAGLLGRLRPDVLQTWLYHADVLGLVAGRLAGVPAIAWNIRCSDAFFAERAENPDLLRRLLPVLSTYPEAIVVNSLAGRRFHESVGYRSRRWFHVPNGVDVERFKPDPVAREAVRAELGIPADALVVGMVARVDPTKDHAGFLRAFATMRQSFPAGQALVVGRGAVPGAPELRKLIDELGLGDSVHLLGERPDIERVLPAMDVFVLASLTEGFPNVVVEAMAAGLPCVVTSVGDCAEIVDGPGVVVAPREVDEMAAALRTLAADPGERVRRGDAGRRSVIARFDIARVLATYDEIYTELGERARGAADLRRRRS